MTPKIIDQPFTEPLTIEECRAHLRIQPYEVDSDGVGTHPDDTLIMVYQSAAREYCENFLGVTLASKTLTTFCPTGTSIANWPSSARLIV